MVQLVTTKKYLTSFTNRENIGLVPTMGNLHEGHLSLVKEAINNHGTVIVTIFVNPTQFGPNEDFESYPRTLEKDTELLQGLVEDNDSTSLIIFAPESINEIYPTPMRVKINVPHLTDSLCGKSRPGHFEGVCGVVTRLFQLTNPRVAYFGQKDFQQQLVIKQLALDLFPHIKIETCPIVREASGLAMSSRNNYLNAGQIARGLHLNKTLNRIKDLILQKSFQEAEDLIESEKKSNLNWDYLEILSPRDLQKYDKNDMNHLVVGALKVDGVKLLDNIVVEGI